MNLGDAPNETTAVRARRAAAILRHMDRVNLVQRGRDLEEGSAKSQPDEIPHPSDPAIHYSTT